MRPSVLAAAVAATLAACAHDLGAPRPSPGPHLDRGEPARGPGARTRTITAVTGLRVTAIEVKDATSAAALFAYTLTGLPDPPGKAGLGMVAALAANRGAMAKGGLRADERLFAAGAVFHASADADALRFHAWLPAQTLAAVVAIEADRLRDPAAGLEDAELEGYRELAARRLEEGRERAPSATLWSALLPGSRYAGEEPTPASVRAVTPDDVRRLLRAAIRPERAAVVVCGPGAAEPTTRAVEAAYAAAVPPQASRPVDLREPSPQPGAVNTGLVRVEGAGEHPVLWLAWAIPGARARSTIGAGLAAMLLDLRLSGRASRGDLEDQVLRVEVEPVIGELASQVRARVVLAPGADAEAVRGALVARAGETAAYFKQLDWVRLRELRAGLRYGVVRSLATGSLEGLDLLVRAGQPDPVEDLELQAEGMLREIEFLLERRIRAELAASVLSTPPAHKEPPPDTAEEGTSPPWPRAPHLFSGAAPGASELATLATPPGLAGGERRVLPNGLTVLLKPRGTHPTALVALYVAADSETPAARADKRVALRALEIAAPRRLAAWNAVPGGFELAAAGPAAYLPHLIERVAAWTWSAPRAGHAASVVDATLEDDRTGRGGGSERGRASLVLAALTSPATAPVSPATPVAAVDADAAVERLPRWFRPDRATLVVTGRVEASEAFWNDVSDAFGRWRGDLRPLEEPPPPPGPERRRVLLLDHPGASRGVVGVYFRVPLAGVRDEGAYLALERQLGDLAGSVAAPVRGAGGVGGRDGARVSYLGPWFRGRRAELPAALAGLLDGLERLRAAPPSSLDVDLARWSAARWLAFGSDDLERRAELLGTTALRGLPAEWAERTPASLAAATPARIHALAREVLGREVIVVSGDAATLAPELRRMGLEPELLPGVAQER